MSPNGDSAAGRKRRLAKLIDRAKHAIRYSDHLAGDGPTMLDHVCAWAGGHRVENAALKVPLKERFHIFTEHEPANLGIDPTYFGIDRSADAIVVQVTLNEGRDADVKRSFYRALADGLHERGSGCASRTLWSTSSK